MKCWRQADDGVWWAYSMVAMEDSPCGHQHVIVNLMNKYDEGKVDHVQIFSQGYFFLKYVLWSDASEESADQQEL